MKFQHRLYLILMGIFIASLVSANLIFQKFFSWTPFGLYTFELSVGILPYPVTFLVTDLISELYGKKKADQVVLSGLVASVFVMGVVMVANAVPQTEWSPVNNETFSKVFGLLVRRYLHPWWHTSLPNLLIFAYSIFGSGLPKVNTCGFGITVLPSYLNWWIRQPY